MRTMMNAVIAGSALMAAQVWAAPYNLDADQSAVTGIDVQVSTGTTTVTNDPSPLPVDGSWTFDFDGSDQVAFTGVINMNRLAPYDSVTAVDTPLGNMEGTISYEGASHSISGVASWDAATRTLTHELPSGGPNSSIGSSYTETASSCQGEGNVVGQTVCGTWGETTPEWEGFTLELTFSEDLAEFSGVLNAIEQSGSGLTANTTTTTFELSGAEVPLPAAAWLFGSALLGLGGRARRARQSR